MRHLFAMLIALVTEAACAQGAVIAAAANLKFALDEIAASFTRDTGHDVRIAYGSTGNLVQQIANGAPFELLLAADEASIERLARAGLAKDGGVVYATGRLVLFVRHGSPVKPDPALADTSAALADGRLKRFAIANPEHAPYGRAARQVLERAGLWEAIRPRLVIGESVSQAMQFAAAPDAQGGLVPLALATAPQVAATGSFVVIPDAAHEPLRQRMALTKRAGPVAVRFHDYVLSASSRAILVRHGYAVPGDSR